MKMSTEERATDAAPPRAPATLSIEEQVLVELRRIIRAAQMSAKQLAREAGLTTSQLVLLELLHLHGKMTSGQIAHAMKLTQATVTNLLDRLQERGLIVRQRGERDRRTVHVQLTREGEQRLAQAPQPLQHRLMERFVELQSWEKTAILAALQRLSHLMDVEALDAAPLLEVGSIDRSAETVERDA